MKYKDHKRLFIREHLLREDVFHGGAGNRDIERVLLKNGYRSIAFPYRSQFGFRAKLGRLLFLGKVIFNLPANALIVFQWPLYAWLHRALIRTLLRLRPSIQLVCFITDIDGIKDDNDKKLSKEIALFRCLKHFIVHNDRMKQWLLNAHPRAHISTIEFFDFLAPINNDPKSLAASVAFAGNLSKSRFIKELGQIGGVDFHLYGEPSNLPLSAEHIFYHGQHEPELLPFIIEGSFGLVWDGDSIGGNEGIFGNYIRLISPHKLSLYILAGMPLIAHSDTAVAELIKKYNIGFTINSLFELPGALAGVTKDAYRHMQENCLQLGDSISEGQRVLNALEELGITPASL